MWRTFSLLTKKRKLNYYWRPLLAVLLVIYFMLLQFKNKVRLQFQLARGGGGGGVEQVPTTAKKQGLSQSSCVSLIDREKARSSINHSILSGNIKEPSKYEGD
jgi:hypothetical protein